MRLLGVLAPISLSIFFSVVQGIVVKRSEPQGIDVSSHQPNINWSSVKDNGISFVYIKATEGTCEKFLLSRILILICAYPAYKSPEFNSQYTGATNSGLIRGAYHFARPDISSGATQAEYFLANGGRYQFDGYCYI